VSHFLLIFCVIFGQKAGKIWTKSHGFCPRILPGFSGRCPGTRKISEKKPQKDLTFARECGILLMERPDWPAAKQERKKVMKKPMVILHNKSSFEILIRRDPEDGSYYCDLPSLEDGAAIPVVVTRDFYFWFLQTNGIVWVDDSFQFAMDQAGDIIPIFLKKST